MNKQHRYFFAIAITALLLMSGYAVFITSTIDQPQNTASKSQAGTLIVYQKRMGTKTEITTYDPATKESRSIYTSDADVLEARMDFNELTIFNHENKDIIRLNVFSQKKTTLTCPECDDVPFFSPNSRSIVYTTFPSDASNISTINILNVDTGTVQEISFQSSGSAPEKLSPIYWGEKNDAVYFKETSATEGMHYGVYMLNLKDLKVTPIQEMQNLIAGSVDPDGFVYGNNQADFDKGQYSEGYEAPASSVVRAYNLNAPEKNSIYQLSGSGAQGIFTQGTSAYLVYTYDNELFLLNKKNGESRSVFKSTEMISRGVIQGSTVAIQEQAAETESIRTFDVDHVSSSQRIVSQSIVGGSLQLLGIVQK